ncbi:MAG: Asp/Glu/hydantoin racemase protein [Microvirga sp.]|jgi:aspartate/glutamate racemase|nr:Asp/Glu/hydantoin racemase protein [Microvirga sp.]
MSARPRIALIHATPVAIEPISRVLAADWPEAEPVNILDDSLSTDRAKVGKISPELTDRIITLGRYAHGLGADGILFTCSAFGPAIEEAARIISVPTLKPNEAMFEAAIGQGQNIAMIGTFPPAQASMEAEFAEEAARLNSKACLTSFLVESAMVALRSGDAQTHHQLVAEKARELSNYDAIVLAQFSTAPAAPLVRNKVSIPVLSSPEAAVVKLRRLMQ